MKDIIELTTEFEFPLDRVWNAVATSREFSAWFGATFQTEFVPGKPAPAVVTYPGYEGLTFEIDIEELRKPSLFSFRWHPYTIDLERDYSSEPKTLVEFRLEETVQGTRVNIREQGFEALDSDRAGEAYEGNREGWENQMEKLSEHLKAD